MEKLEPFICRGARVIEVQNITIQIFKTKLLVEFCAIDSR